MHRSTAEREEAWVDEIGSKLHDLAQPLTALQCRLEIGSLHHESDEMRNAIEDALRECDRLNKMVHSMQETMRRVAKQRSEAWD